MTEYITLKNNYQHSNTPHLLLSKKFSSLRPVKFYFPCIRKHPNKKTRFHRSVLNDYSAVYLFGFFSF